MKPLFIIVPILLIGGTLGAAFMGVVNIPGVTPKKAEAKKQEPAQENEPTEETQPTDETGQAATIEDPDLASQSEPSQPAQVQPQQPATDPAQGAKALAKIWDEIDTSKLLPITDTFKESDLAQVLFYMKKDKVADVLGAVDADRAAKLSRELQRLASVVVTETP
jgi:hypothetical protein